MSTLDTAIALFRRERVTRFRAECIVTRTTTDGVFDPVTGNIGAAAEDTIYEGPCNVREMAWQGSDVTAGDRELRMRQSELLLPFDIPILENDVVTVTSATYDSSLVGRSYRITDVFLDAWQITRRAMLEKITGGAE